MAGERKKGGRPGGLEPGGGEGQFLKFNMYK